MNLSAIPHYLMTLLSLVTAFGVFAHDTRVDKAGPSLLGSMSTHKSQLTKTTAKFTDFGSAPDPHTHSHHSVGRSLLSGFVYQSPSIAPRRKSHHRELFHQTARPRYAFDNAALPLLA